MYLVTVYLCIYEIQCAAAFVHVIEEHALHAQYNSWQVRKISFHLHMACRHVRYSVMQYITITNMHNIVIVGTSKYQE